MGRVDETLQKYLEHATSTRAGQQAKALKALERAPEASPAILERVVEELGPEVILREVARFDRTVLSVAKQRVKIDGWFLSHDIAADVLSRYSGKAAWREEAEAVADVLGYLHRSWGPPETKAHFARLASQAKPSVGKLVVRRFAGCSRAVKSVDNEVAWVFVATEARAKGVQPLWRGLAREDRDDRGELLHHLYLAALQVTAPGFDALREELGTLAAEANPGTEYPSMAKPAATKRKSTEKGPRAAKKPRSNTTRRSKAVPGEPAAERLRDLVVEPHVLDPKKGVEIAKDLAAARDRLTAPERRRVVAALAEHEPDVLLAAARKPLAESMRSEIAKQLRKQRHLASQFYAFAVQQGAGPEAAELIHRFEQSPHFPSLSKRLAKLDASETMLEVARGFLRKRGLARGDLGDVELVGFLVVYGLIGLLVKDGSEASLAVVKRVTKAMGQHGDDDESLRPAEFTASLLEKHGTTAGAAKLALELRAVLG